MRSSNTKKGYASTKIHHLETGTNCYILVHAMFVALFSTALFLYGFFPLKHYDDSIASMKEIPNHVEGVRIKDDVAYEPIIKKVITVIIDGLRWDFLDEPKGKEYMPVTRKLIDTNLACLLQAKVDSPTVTMPRIKAITTGTVPSFIDVALNFGNKKITGDSLLLQAKNHGHKLIFYGDDTWIRLFPDIFDRYEGTTSFFVSDYTEVDNNVTRHIDMELNQDDWSIMVLHYLGLDHIGHIDGAHSPLIKPKLNEMDEIINKIHSHVSKWNAEDIGTLILVCGDHGMKDSGGHGGNSAQETLVPFVAIGTSCPQKDNEINKIAQIDISSTLAILLGLPIPSSNLGSISLHLLSDLPTSKILFSLYYNAKQVYRHFSKLSNHRRTRAYEKYENAIKLHSAWLEVYGHMNETVEEILHLYIEALEGMREALTSTMIKYDLRIMAIAVLFMYQVLHILATEEQAVATQTKRILYFFITNTILWILLNRLWDAENEGLLYSSDVNSMTFFTVVTIILCTNSYICTKFVITLKSIREHLTNVETMQLLLTLGTMIHALSLFSSSFVEEEHRTWWFLWSTLCILLLRDLIKICFSYTPRYNFAIRHVQSFAKLLLCLVTHNILRHLNSTGDMYAHLPDMADWLQQQESRIYMTVVLIFALAFLVFIGYSIEEDKYKNVSVIIYLAVAICIYLRHMANESVLRIPMIPASRGIYEVNAFWCFMVIFAALSIFRIGKTAQHYRSNILRQLLCFTVQMWVMLSAMLHRPYNVGLLPVQLFTSIIVHVTLQQCNKEYMITHVHYLLGNVFYFYQGNSNNLSTIDVAAGYVGMQSYNFYLTGLFLIVNTYSAPILSYLVLLYGTECRNSNSKLCIFNLLQINRNYATWRLLPLAVYTIVVSIQRYHLFVWTVFSPKLLYEAMYSVVLYSVLDAKLDTYPDNIKVDEIISEVPLQDLLNHTTKRLLTFLNLQLQENASVKLVLEVKYGFDGSHANSYKQKWSNKRGDDAFLFCSSLVPLQLNVENSSQILWKNPRPSSARLCRPIRIQFEKETDILTKAEDQHLKNQIADLQPFSQPGCSVKFHLSLTMIDGKTTTVLNDSSSQKCHICDATISEMNDIQSMTRKLVKVSPMETGIPILHAKIRFLECVLHVSYRLEIKKWRVAKVDREILNEKKRSIQDELRQALGILVDTPKQGFGSTDDGNTARTFFKNIDTVARITGFDRILLEKFMTILGVLASGYSVRVEVFREYCLETAEMFVHLYPWYYMPTSVHVVLIHGYRIIQHFILPIGMLSEEAQECKNKDIKRYRENHARKDTRIHTNTDTFQRLLLSSDPLISLTRDIPTKMHANLTSAMINLLVLPDDHLPSP